MSYVLLVLLAVLVAPFVAEALRVPVRRLRKQHDTMNIAQLPKGATHYRWSGPEDGDVFVCVHGLSTPSYIFAATEKSLADLGYRVLSYDLYGRGLSDRTLGQQDVNFFLDQLRALLIRLEVRAPVSMLGFSMGAQIVAAFAAEEPEWVDQLAFVAPAGLSMVETTGQDRFWTMPVIGDWATWLFGGIALRRELEEHKSVATILPDLEERQAAETRTRGFLPALLSSRRHTLSQNSDAHHTQIFEADIPVLAIWGGEDPVIPLAAMGRLAKLNPDVYHVQIPGAGHNLLQTHPAQVADALKANLVD